MPLLGRGRASSATRSKQDLDVGLLEGLLPPWAQETTLVGQADSSYSRGRPKETLRLRNTTSTPTSAKPPIFPYTVPIPANSGIFCCPIDKAGHSKNSHGFQTHFHPSETEQKGSLVARVPDLCSSVLTYFPDLL